MVSRFTGLALGGFWVASLCFGASFAEEGNPARQVLLAQETLARVGDRVITVDQFRAELTKRAGLSGQPPATADALAAVLEELVRREVLLTRAREAGYADDPELKTAFERLMIRAYLRDRLEERLDGLGVTDAEVEARYQSELAERGPARQQSLALVAPGIRHQLLREKRAALEKAFEEEIRAGLVIEIDAARLRALEIPTADQAPPAMPGASTPTESASLVSSPGEKP